MSSVFHKIRFSCGHQLIFLQVICDRMGNLHILQRRLELVLNLVQVVQFCVARSLVQQVAYRQVNAEHDSTVLVQIKNAVFSILYLREDRLRIPLLCSKKGYTVAQLPNSQKEFKISYIMYFEKDRHTKEKIHSIKCVNESDKNRLNGCCFAEVDTQLKHQSKRAEQDTVWKFLGKEKEPNCDCRQITSGQKRSQN